MPVTTPAVVAGLAACYPLEADLTKSTLGQAGPVAGRPEPQEDAQGRRPALVLSATGAQTATTTLDVVTQTPGNVGQAGYRWRRDVSGSTDTYWRGNNLPNVLQGAAFPGWAAASNQAVPHAVTLPDDSQVVVYRQTNGVTRDIKAIVWDPATETYSSAVTVDSGLDASHEPSPALCVIADPGGGDSPIVLCAYWLANDTTNEGQIRVMSSKDGGATWALWSDNVLPAAITLNAGAPHYTLGQIRWSQIGSQIVLFAMLSASTPLATVWQYASGDLGVSFTKIGELDTLGYADVVTVGACGYVGYLLYDSGGPAVYAILKTLPNPWTLVEIDTIATSKAFLFDLTDAGIVAASVFTFGALSLSASPTGTIVATLIRPVGGGGAQYAGLSALYYPATGQITNGILAYGQLPILSSWSAGAAGYRLWWWDGNAVSTEYPTQIAATWYRGQVRVYAIFASATATFDDRVTRLDVGGMTTISLPVKASTGYASGQVAWQVTSIPTALASAYGATFAGAGTRSISTNTGWETLTTVAQAAYYTRTVIASASQQVYQLLRVRVDSGGSITSRAVSCGLRAAGVGYGFEFALLFSTTQIRFRDVNAGVYGTTVTPTLVGGVLIVDVLMAISGGGTASAWYRVVGTDEDSYFLPIDVGYTLTDDAGAGGVTNVISWGNVAVSTATSRWVDTGYNSGDSLGSANLAAGLTLPTDLRGIPYAAQGAYVAAGVSIGATVGPTIRGDEWLIRPDANHPVRYLLPTGDDDSTWNVKGGMRTSSTEAASAWWSTATTGDLAVGFHGGANQYMTPLTAIHTERLNAAQPSVIAYDTDAAAWTVLGTLNNSSGGLRYLRASTSSPTVRVDTSGSSTTINQIRSGELVGGYFIFDNAKTRPIVANTQGQWSNDGTGPTPILTLGGIDGTEDTSGTSGRIIWPRATFVFASTAATEYSAFGLRWTIAPYLYESQIRATVFAVCPLESLLYAQQWGTAYSNDDPAVVFQSYAGLRRGRQTLNAARRKLTIPMSAMYNQILLQDPTYWAPAWYKAYSNASYPVAGAMGDESGKLLGAWLRAVGSRSPAVWIPRISTAATTQTLVGQAAGFYCRVTSPPTFTDDLGRNLSASYAQVLRGDNWTLEEEI